jgi:hypothetical protein
MAKKSLYIPDDIDRDIIAAGEGESYSGRVAYLLTIASKAMQAELPGLHVGEWCAIADALNGHWPSYEQGVPAVLGSAWHSVFDSAPELDAKWKVDCAVLARRLLDMPLTAQAGVYEIARAFWRRGAEVAEDAANYAVVFERLGAPILPVVAAAWRSPVFADCPSRKSITVSASCGATRLNLGEIAFSRASGELYFSPNNVHTGGADAAAAVSGWIAEHRAELLGRLRAMYDPTMLADTTIIAAIDAVTAAG